MQWPFGSTMALVWSLFRTFARDILIILLSFPLCWTSSALQLFRYLVCSCLFSSLPLVLALTWTLCPSPFLFSFLSFSFFFYSPSDISATAFYFFFWFFPLRCRRPTPRFHLAGLPCIATFYLFLVFSLCGWRPTPHVSGLYSSSSSVASVFSFLISFSF